MKKRFTVSIMVFMFLINGYSLMANLDYKLRSLDKIHLFLYGGSECQIIDTLDLNGCFKINKSQNEDLQFCLKGKTVIQAGNEIFSEIKKYYRVTEDGFYFVVSQKEFNYSTKIEISGVQIRHKLAEEAVVSLKSTSIDNRNVFQSVTNKTWIEDEGFSIIFYETNRKLKKAIRQLQGSGVYIVKSEIYDVKVSGDKLILFNGLNLVTSEKLEMINYQYDKRKERIIRNGESIEVSFEKPILHDWTNLPNITGKEIDLNKLKRIVIEENRIYDLDNLKKAIKE